MRNSMREFDVRKAYCYDADRDLLLGAIESGYSTLSKFNDEMRKALLAALRTAHIQNWAGTNERQALHRFGEIACVVKGALWLRRQSASKERKPASTHAPPVKILWRDVMKLAWDDLEAGSAIVDFAPTGTAPLAALAPVPALVAPSLASKGAFRAVASAPLATRYRMVLLLRSNVFNPPARPQHLGKVAPAPS